MLITILFYFLIELIKCIHHLFIKFSKIKKVQLIIIYIRAACPVTVSNTVGYK